MFDISWGEMLIIGAVALVVIGPKELPKALRTLGQMTTKLRRMAGEFRSQFDEAIREAEFDDIKRDLRGVDEAARSATASGFDPIGTIRNEIKTAVEAKSGPEAGVSIAAVALAADGGVSPETRIEVPADPEPLMQLPALPDLPPLDLAPPPVPATAEGRP